MPVLPYDDDRHQRLQALVEADPDLAAFARAAHEHVSAVYRRDFPSQAQDETPEGER